MEDNNEVEKLKNPIDEVIKKMLEKQAGSCAWAKVKLDELNEQKSVNNE